MRGHQTGDNFEAVGNAEADAAAKIAAGYQVGLNMVTLVEEKLQDLRPRTIKEWAAAKLGERKEEQDRWQKKEPHL